MNIRTCSGYVRRYLQYLAFTNRLPEFMRPFGRLDGWPYSSGYQRLDLAPEEAPSIKICHICLMNSIDFGTTCVFCLDKMRDQMKRAETREKSLIAFKVSQGFPAPCYE